MRGSKWLFPLKEKWPKKFVKVVYQLIYFLADFVIILVYQFILYISYQNAKHKTSAYNLERETKKFQQTRSLKNGFFVRRRQRQLLTEIVDSTRGTGRMASSSHYDPLDCGLESAHDELKCIKFPVFVSYDYIKDHTYAEFQYLQKLILQPAVRDRHTVNSVLILSKSCPAHRRCLSSSHSFRWMRWFVLVILSWNGWCANAKKLWRMRFQMRARRCLQMHISWVDLTRS